MTSRNAMVTWLDSTYWRADLLASLKNLRVWESQWLDLAYASDDPRAVMFDNEQPPELITERQRLREVVWSTTHVALLEQEIRRAKDREEFYEALSTLDDEGRDALDFFRRMRLLLINMRRPIER